MDKKLNFDVEVDYIQDLTVEEFGNAFLIRCPEDIIIYPGSSINIDTRIKVYMRYDYKVVLLPIDSITKSTRLRIPYQEILPNSIKENIILTIDNTEPIYMHKILYPYEINYINDNKIKRIDGSYITSDKYMEYFGNNNPYPKGSYYIRKGEEIAKLLFVKINN